MHYATADNRIGSASELPNGALEVSRERYKELMDAKISGERVTVVDGEAVTYTSPVYAPNGTERQHRRLGEPLITEAPPAELHVPRWEDGEWVEAETDEQREAREAEEKQAEREHLDAMTASRFQAKAALDDAGLLDQVEDYMAGDDVPRRVKLAWQEASFRRGSRMVNDIGAELGLSESEIDALFQAAQHIEA